MRAGRIPLRDALDRVALTGKIRLSYAADLLPLTKLVCVEYESVSISSILAGLLEGTPLTPVAIATDQIALAPGREGTARRKAETAPVLDDIGQLERVVVTGVAGDAAQRASPIALGVISSDDVARRNPGSLAAAIDGSVPGLWLWEQSPLSTLARYGSIRGASSFGVSYPKVYVDGIEVANSLLVTHLDPASISRIEIIRGPQGAALYGADAISGVMNIVTRQDGTADGSSRAELRTRGGASASDYSASSVIAQSHSASVRHGNGARSARAGVTATHIGAFIPEAFSRQLSASGGLRHVDSRTVITGTLRLFAQDSRSPFSPVLAPITQRVAGLASPGIVTDSTTRQAVRQYTLGSTATYTWSERWTHSAVVGIDGYTLRNSGMADAAFPSAADSALQAAAGNAMRATIRASSVGQFGNEDASATVTVTAEHSVLRDASTSRAPLEGSAPGEAAAKFSWAGSRSNTGVVGQVSAGLRNALFVTGGVRLERNSSTSGLGDIAALPMLGLSAVRSLGSTTVKLRSAYGRGIRPVQPASRMAALMGFSGSLLGASLEPEVQSGLEIGADAFFGEHVTLRVTRFDQTASGLVQPVGVAARIATDSGPRYRHVGYELQNVGSISNRGWELQGSFSGGPWSFGAVYSQVDSRVGELGKYYTGDLRTGDRMLEVPSHTFGLNAGYARGRWSSSWSVSRAADWINYDRIALLDALRRSSPDDKPPVGAELRSFWKSYEGVTRLGGSLSLILSRGMTLTLDGENLLDEQRGEPDNITVLPGRTVSAGLRLSF